MTLNELLKVVLDGVKAGHGNKTVIISDDDEGNSYHNLFYGLTTKSSEVKNCIECSNSVLSDFNENDYKNIVILG